MNKPTIQHTIEINCDPPARSGALVRNGGHRAHCACGWWSDCYAQMSDTQRAIEVHLRRAQREDFEGLIARSSIGAAIADIKERGIDAHLIDLERAMSRASRGRRRRPRRIARSSKARVTSAPPRPRRRSSSTSSRSALL